MEGGPSSRRTGGHSRNVRTSRMDSRTSRRGDSRIRASMIGGKGKSAQDSGPQPVIVRDANGHDVTPRSLNSAAAEPTRSLPTGGSEIDPLTSMTEAPPGGEAYGGRTLERSHSSAGSDAGDSQNESISLFRVETKSHKTSAEAAAAAQVESAPVALTESDLDAPVVIELRETSTFWLLEETGTCVATDSILAPKARGGHANADHLAYAYVLPARSTLDHSSRLCLHSCRPPHSRLQ
eukprot:3481567-Pleurochrysis_carterae.AAC.1